MTRSSRKVDRGYRGRGHLRGLSPRWDRGAQQEQGAQLPGGGQEHTAPGHRGYCEGLHEEI